VRAGHLFAHVRFQLKINKTIVSCIEIFYNFVCITIVKLAISAVNISAIWSGASLPTLISPCISMRCACRTYHRNLYVVIYPFVTFVNRFDEFLSCCHTVVSHSCSFPTIQNSQGVADRSAWRTNLKASPAVCLARMW
jgi:hypothetical protein